MVIVAGGARLSACRKASDPVVKAFLRLQRVGKLTLEWQIEISKSMGGNEVVPGGYKLPIKYRRGVSTSVSQGSNHARWL